MRADNWTIIEGLAKQVRWHLVRPITELSCRPVTIKAQEGEWRAAEWWPMNVAARVREVVPRSVVVTAREDLMREIIEVTLVEPWWRKLRRRVGLGGDWRRSVMVVACGELADAPVGLVVRVAWA
jgi:hypothetical protein